MKKTKIQCENCGEPIEVIYYKNRWVEWFKGYCEICGYRFQLKDAEFDYIQPDNPLFDLIYKYHPEWEVEKNKKVQAWEEEQRKEELEEKYYNMYKSSKIKPWEKKSLDKIVLKEK